MFERRHQPLAARRTFVLRILRNSAIAGGIIGSSLGLGILGYHVIAGLEWIDSIYNASMILTGMGPVNAMTTPSSKLFASAYALFSGLVFVSTFALVLGPVLHRIMHRFHLDGEEHGAKRNHSH